MDSSDSRSSEPLHIPMPQSPCPTSLTSKPVRPSLRYFIRIPRMQFSEEGYASRANIAPLSLPLQRNRRHVCRGRSEEHTSELQSQSNLVCRLLLEKKKTKT